MDDTAQKYINLVTKKYETSISNLNDKVLKNSDSFDNEYYKKTLTKNITAR